MTTFVSHRVATPAVSPRRFAGSLSSARTWVGDRTRSYRAAADLHCESTDALGLKMFARD